MKIGIVTFHSAHNYGAVLQAWSLQEYLKRQGHVVEIVNLRLPVIDNLYRFRATNRKFCKYWKLNKLMNYGYGNVHYILKKMRYPYVEKKYRKFERFIKQRLSITKVFHSLAELKKAKLNYDALIAGSDQIWNSKMMKGINPAYFLQFGNKSALRISYAASIGTEVIPGPYQQLFQRYLRDFDVISVREKNAKEQIQQFTDKEIYVMPDPTFLLRLEEFDRLKRKPRVSGKYIYVHNVHLKKVDETLYGIAEEISRRTGLKVIHNHRRQQFQNDVGHFTGGVEEFLGYVESAEMVITNSFHCTVFSLLYKRPFVAIPHFENPDRISNLLSDMGILNHLIDSCRDLPDNLEELLIDYGVIEEKIVYMREQAKEFINKALKSQKISDTRTYFEYKDAFRCYGCGACKDICPVDAISMESDKEGFVYPEIKEELCIGCKKCRQVCINTKEMRNPSGEQEFPMVYAAYNKHADVLKASTSGGMFTPMYRYILSLGGKVAGVVYNEKMDVVYAIAAEEGECGRFHGSKYIFADSGTIKIKVKELLDEGEYVLFSGSPCQIAALKSFLGKEYGRLYSVEIICHAALSPKVFKKYREFLEERYQSKITSFTFRNKFKGIKNPVLIVEFASGSLEMELGSENNLFRGFLDDNIQRPSCYMCEFGLLKNGVADITIGDYWGIEKQHPDFVNDQGVSVLKINTVKGQRIFEEIKDDLVLKPSTYESAYKANHRAPKSFDSSRSKLMYYIDDKPIDDLLMTFNNRKAEKLKLD